MRGIIRCAALDGPLGPGALGALALGVVALTLMASPARAQAHDEHPATALPDSSAITPQMVERGRAVFRSQGQCFVCHGEHLEGSPIAPMLRAHPWKDAAGGTLPEIYRVITHGVTNTAMVAHPGGVSDENAALVAVYVWSVSHGHAKP